MTLSETQTPPGGWEFYQPQFNWWLPGPISVTLDQATELVIKIRMKNSAITKAQNLSVDFGEVREEILAYTRMRLGIHADPKGVAPFGAEAGGAAAGVVRNLFTGAKVQAQWLGDGGHPVDPQLAVKRAKVCTKCDLNKPSNIWLGLDRHAANSLKKLIEIKEGMKLETTQDHKLHSCQACNCVLHFKIWAPLKHILHNLNDSDRRKLWTDCWITAEERGSG